MPLELWLAYVFTSAVVLAIPGPTILLVLSYSISRGRQATLPLVAGVALGDALAVTLSLIGLGSLLAASAFWFTVIKLIGGLYLIYLGVQLFRGASQPPTESTLRQTETRFTLFLNAFLVTALNPKSILFFVALLPQFISVEHQTTTQLWLLGVTFVVMATIGATLYASFASRVRRGLQSPKIQKFYAYFAGSLLCGAGVWALAAKPVLAEQ